MNLKKTFKKKMSVLLSAAMVFSLAATFNTPLQASAATAEEPSVTKYAAQEELKDFGVDPTKTVQKVYFGKGRSGSAQTWYIAGYDNNGLVLICNPDEPLIVNQQFNTSLNDITSGISGTYVGTAPSTVGANHYGSSAFRKALQSLATNASYFTTTEQGLMKSTTVYTDDIKNDLVYSTSDKLYLPYGLINTTTFSVGANTADSLTSGVKVYISKFPTTDYEFDYYYKLRTPNGTYGVLSWGEDTWSIWGDEANAKNSAGAPAFDLNLSAVLFGSAAKAATAGAALGDTMTFRFDAGTGTSAKIKSTASCDNSGVTVTKNSSDSSLYLYVQGKDDGTDWVYSKAITSSGTIALSDIHSGADLSKCKVWLEKTTSNVTYAVMAQNNAKPIEDIESVAITDIVAPEAGEELDTEAVCSEESVATDTPAVTWTPEAADGIASYDTEYTASVTLSAAAGYVFTENTTATVDGNVAETSYDSTAGTLTVTYTYPATAKPDLIDITEPDAITGLPNGTEKTAEALGLPEKVEIAVEDDSVTEADVTWNLDDALYDPSVVTEQTFTVTGTIALPESIANGQELSLEVEIEVTVMEADFTGIPQSDLEAGIYKENQSVTLSSDTEGAKIYYTTDGSDPTTDSTEYNGAIDITGQAGESVTTTIKAIAVKDGMQNSVIAEFTYVIEIPMNAPATVKAASSGYNQIKITWSEIPGAEGYIISRATSQTGTYTDVAVVSSTARSYVNTGLTTGKTYYYRVQAYKKVNNMVSGGEYSAVVSAVPKLSISSLTTSRYSYNANKVSWTGVSGASGYQIYRATSKTGTYNLVKTASSTARSYVNSKLTTGTTYYYKVRAYRTVNGEKVYGDFSTIKSAKPTLSTPAGLSISKSSSTYVKVKWNGISGETGYQVYRATSKNGKYAKVASVKMTTYKYPYAKIKTTKGKKYYYKVRAYKKVGSKYVYSNFSSPKLYTLK